MLHVRYLLVPFQERSQTPRIAEEPVLTIWLGAACKAVLALSNLIIIPNGSEACCLAGTECTKHTVRCGFCVIGFLGAVLMLQVHGREPESIRILATAGHGNSIAWPISSYIVLRCGNFARKVEELYFRNVGKHHARRSNSFWLTCFRRFASVH